MSADADWYGGCFRKVHLDMHTPMGTTGAASAIDPDAFARMWHDAGAQAICFFAKGAYGHSFYPTRIGHPVPDLQRDLLGEVCEACHRYDIRLIAYYHVQGFDYLLEEHPDWVAQELDGGPHDRPWFCLNSPVLGEVLVPQVTEIVEHYPVDGMFFDGAHVSGFCGCRWCRWYYAAQIGGPMPTEPTPALVRWRLDHAAQWRGRLIEASCARPEVRVTCNWAWTARSAEPAPRAPIFLSQDVAPTQTVLDHSFYGHYLAGQHVPWDIMNARFVEWWGDWSTRPAASVMQTAAITLALGGRTFVGDQHYPDGRCDPASVRVIRKTFDFVRQREPWCGPFEPVYRVGAAHTTSSALIEALHSPLESVRGVHRTLCEAHVPFVLLNETELVRKLPGLDLAVLADQRHLSRAVLDAVREFVRTGGTLLATHRTSLCDPDGAVQDDFALADVFGVSFKETAGSDHGYIRPNDTSWVPEEAEQVVLMRGASLDVEPTTAQMMGTRVEPAWPGVEGGQPHSRTHPPGDDTGRPMLTCNRFGQGTCWYIPGEVFAAIYRRNDVPLKRFLQRLIESLVADPLLRVEASPLVQVTLHRVGESVVVHLVSLEDGLRGPGNPITEQLPWVCGVQLDVAVAGRVERVHLEPQGDELAFRQEGGRVHVDVPPVRLHAMVVIEGTGV